jgi:transcriptional regulator with XRE-family HTH domain
MEIHIGKTILKKLEEKGMKKSEFARRINKSRQNVQDIFRRESLDTNLLADVCKVLSFDFFQLLSTEKNSNPSLAMEEEPLYKTGKQEGQKQKLQLELLSKELKQAQKEIQKLKKVNGLLEKKLERRKR